MNIQRVLVETAALVILAACGGASGSSDGGTAALPPSQLPGNTGAATSSAPPLTPASNPTEKPLKDTLRGGVAVGSDGLIYASGIAGLQVFNQQLNLFSSSSGVAASPSDTWAHSPGLVPAGPVLAAGNTIEALAVLPNPKNAASTTMITPLPTSEPALAQYDVPTKTWFNVSFGFPGNLWVSIALSPFSQAFIVGDTLMPTGWVGMLVPVSAVACVQPAFTNPLGASVGGPDGKLWIATDPSLNSTKPSDSSNPSKILVVDPSVGSILRVYTLPAGSQIRGMASAANGVWFTDEGLNAVGLARTSGGFTIFPLKSGKGRAPMGITQGSDGAFWFTEFNGNTIGRIDPVTDAITEFKVPTANAHPNGIIGCNANSPCVKGAVFFTEDHALGKLRF